MDIDNHFFPQALGPGGLDVIHAQHVDHGGPHIPGDAANARNGHDNHRQGHVPQGVQGRLQGVALKPSRSHAADGENGDLHREGENGQQGNDEAGQAVANNGDHLDGLVEDAVLAHCGGNAKGYSNEEGDQHRDQVEHHSVQHRGADHVDDILLILGGIAKVPGEHIANPPDVLDDQGAVQAQVFPSLIVQPLIGVRLHVGLCVAQHHGHGVAGHNFIDKEHQDGNDEENEHNIDKSLQQISAFSHLNPPISR